MLHVGYWYHSSLLKGGDTMSNDILMLLFEGGLFLISLLTFIVLLIEKISKK
ncbi:putative holin-like toxin [Clostridium tyrobutyricum]|uniref:putative holin-like toxin n=1 Tax=Clostridium tyrobutyricum TaxID=1519 RepID=UPI0034A0B22D